MRNIAILAAKEAGKILLSYLGSVDKDLKSEREFVTVFSVSIAVEKDNEIILGVVYDPIREELFEAEKDKKSRLNGRQIYITKTKELKKSRLLTGFPYNMKKDNNLDYFMSLVVDALELRVDGSAALDLCYVACGRADGYWELKLKPWDTAAGKIIVECAGGSVSQINGERFDPYIPNLLATNGKIHNEMVSMFNVRC
ncbi:hypothetical protein KAX02_00960 [candidate division WOR-3 bacterium]|nr:hypothetical protein [candidate division WOR-3 bacterium]